MKTLLRHLLCSLCLCASVVLLPAADWIPVTLDPAGNLANGGALMTNTINGISAQQITNLVWVGLSLPQAPYVISGATVDSVTFNNSPIYFTDSTTGAKYGLIFTNKTV